MNSLFIVVTSSEPIEWQNKNYIKISSFPGERAVEVPTALVDAANEQKLVLFLGAGVSAGAGMPTWNNIVCDLLNEKADHIKNAKLLLANLEAKLLSPLEILDKLIDYKSLIYGHFESKLKELKESELHKLMGSTTSKFITTNFDKLIEHNCSLACVIDQTSSHNLRKLDSFDSYVLKIHGDISHIDHCVIFSRDYDNVYNSSSLATFQLGKIVTQNKCIFIGFSFDDPYVSNFFKHIDGLYKGIDQQFFAIGKEEIRVSCIKNILVNEFDEIFSFFSKIKSSMRETVCSPPSNSTPSKTIENTSFIVSGTDSPPEVEHWVGRRDELQELARKHKSTFITGFGGQGKSALAAEFIKTKKTLSSAIKTDWRDFKEDDHNFQSKLISMINLVTENSISDDSLVGLNTESLINLFFSHLEDQEFIFVFDNIDKYIDRSSFLPFGPMDKFFRKTLRENHKSQFIFTCRPFINYAGVGFYQLTLDGLTEEDVKVLAQMYKLGSGPIN